MKYFYNTIDETGITLAKPISNAVNQEQKVMIIFHANPYKEYTPFGVNKILSDNGNRYPITSIRRAMTNLTEQGILIKTDNKVNEQYGVKNYTWKLRTVGQTALF